MGHNKEIKGKGEEERRGEEGEERRAEGGRGGEEG